MVKREAEIIGASQQAAGKSQGKREYCGENVENMRNAIDGRTKLQRAQ